MNEKDLTENDRNEVQKLRHYLRACKDWNDANDTHADLAAMTDDDMDAYRKKRNKAHADIYENIYGVRP